MVGGLRIEMAAFKMLGKWVSGSGWVEAICNSGVATQGVAESFLTPSHLTRTRHAHQVTAASLFALMRSAYSDYKERMKDKEGLMSEEEWKEAITGKCPQFLYWAYILSSILEKATSTCICILYASLLPCMFAMDHGNYARLMSVHYRDMCILSSKQAASLCTRRFSSIALDHAHEQVNARVKGEGGAVRLAENPAALRRWMVAGPR